MKPSKSPNLLTKASEKFMKSEDSKTSLTLLISFQLTVQKLKP